MSINLAEADKLLTTTRSVRKRLDYSRPIPSELLQECIDVAIQAQILNLMQGLQREFGLTYLFISHDLGVIRYMCDEIAVMYLGLIVEQADREELFTRPLHPYTLALWSAAPSFNPKARGRGQRIRLQGDPPSPIDVPPGCRFAGRCPFAEPRCHTEPPELREVRPGHKVACHRVDDGGRPLYEATTRAS